MADSLTTDAVAKVMEPAGAELRLKALVAALSHPDRSHAALRRACPLGDGTGNRRVGRVEWRHGECL